MADYLRGEPAIHCVAYHPSQRPVFRLSTVPMSAKGMRIIRAIEGEGDAQKTEDFEVSLASIANNPGPRDFPQILRSP